MATFVDLPWFGCAFAIREMRMRYACGFGHAQVIPLNMLVGTIQLLVVCPLFVPRVRDLRMAKMALSLDLLFLAGILYSRI